MGVVICGWDLDFNFYKLATASLYVQKNPGFLFLATNREAFDQMGDRTIPGNGAAVSAICTALGGVEPLCTGKPSPWSTDTRFRRYTLDRTRTIMVGDRMDTDISAGNNGSIATALVYTGCTTAVEATRMNPADAASPDFLLAADGPRAKL